MRTLNSTTIYNWFQQVWNEGNREAIDRFLSDGVIAHGLDADGPLRGIENFKKNYDTFRTQLKDIHITVERVISEDNYEAAYCSVTATDVSGGKAVSFHGQVTVRLNPDGKIAEGWNTFDFFTMYTQAGYRMVL